MRRLVGQDEKEGPEMCILLDSHLLRISCLQKMGCYNLSFRVWPGISLLGAEGYVQAPQQGPGTSCPRMTLALAGESLCQEKW